MPSPGNAWDLASSIAPDRVARSPQLAPFLLRPPPLLGAACHNAFSSLTQLRFITMARSPVLSSTTYPSLQTARERHAISRQIT